MDFTVATALEIRDKFFQDNGKTPLASFCPWIAQGINNNINDMLLMLPPEFMSDA